MWIDTVGLKCILKNLLNYLTPSLWNMLEKNKMYELNKIQNAIKECIKLQDSMLDNIFLLVNSPKSVELIRKDLTGVVNPLLLHVIKQLPEEMKVNLLPNIIEVMKNLDGNTKLCQDIILSIDKNWLKKIFGYTLKMQLMIKIIKILEYLSICLNLSVKNYLINLLFWH